MLSKGFNKEFFESVYKLNECGGSGTGGCGANKASCGRGGGCGFTESLQVMNECGGNSGYSISYSSCGGSGYSSSGCGGSYSDKIGGYCKIGSMVEISYNAGCGVMNTTHGILLGYAD